MAYLDNYQTLPLHSFSYMIVPTYTALSQKFIPVQEVQVHVHTTSSNITTTIVLLYNTIVVHRPFITSNSDIIITI